MAKQQQKSTAAQLLALVKQLQAERQDHERAIAEIDAVLGGMDSAPAPRAAGKRAHRRRVVAAAKPAPKKRRRARRKFETSGNDLILGFVKAAGAKGVKTSEIVKHWKSEGRTGDGYVQLSQLTKAGKIKKQNIKGERGSKYSVA